MREGGVHAAVAMTLFRSVVWRAAGLLAPLVEQSPVVRSLIRHARFPGRGTIVSRLRGERMPAASIIARCGGLLFDLDLRDDVQRAIYFNAYDRADLDAVLPRVHSGGTCLDVGANVGFYTLHLARRVGTRGRVYAFEPDARLANMIERNCRLNGFEQIVKVHRVAISDSAGIARFYRSTPGHSGWGSLVEFADIADSVDEVPTATLDSILGAERVGVVDLMKMDIEANELEGLAGARDTLRAGRIHHVLIEFNGVRLAERGRTLDEMVALFADVGYQASGWAPHVIEACRNGRTNPASICLNLLFSLERSVGR